MCILPWMHIETSPIGTLRPCCLAIDEIVDDNGNKFDLNTSSISDVFASKYMQDLRQQFANGEKPKTCSRCWNEEASGRTSKRINTMYKFKEFTLEHSVDQTPALSFIDLKLGNICNLKCRICGSWSSSKWAKEEIDYSNGSKDHIAHSFLKQGAWPRQNENFWKDLHSIAQDITSIEFTGGEPFLIQEHFGFLQFCVDQGYSKNIEIHYNTNATVYPDHALEHIWPHFASVEIAFSIDDVGKRFEYQRYGADWERANQIIDNIHQNRKNINLQTQLCFTINLLNVLHIKELLEWADTKGFDHVHWTMLHDPKKLSVNAQPKDIRQKLEVELKKYQFDNINYEQERHNLIMFIRNGSINEVTLQDVKKYIEKTDQYRNQNLKSIDSELFGVIYA